MINKRNGLVLSWIDCNGKQDSKCFEKDSEKISDLLGGAVRIPLPHYLQEIGSISLPSLLDAASDTKNPSALR